MARLPNPNSDADQWGALLNEFLLVSHRKDGTLKGVQEAINVRDCGARGNAVDDDTRAIQSAISAISDHGGIVYFPAGTYNVSGPIHVRKHRTHIRGAGIHATQIRFNPATPAPLFDFDASPAVLFQCSIKDLGLFGMGSTQKIAIRATDTSELTIESIGVFHNWTGNTSIGLQLRGRELGTIRKVSLFADRPISIENNPNDTIDLDHFHFEDLYLCPQVSSESCIYIAPNINLTNITIDGTNSFCKGKHGIYWNDDQPTKGTSLGLNFQNIRREQTETPDGYTIFVNHYVQNFLLQNIAADVRAKGFFFRKVGYLTLQNCFYPGRPGTTPLPEAFNADGTCWDIVLQNCFFQVGSTKFTNGLEEVFSFQKCSGAFPSTVYYDKSSNPNRWIRIYGTNTFRHTGVLEVDSRYTIPFHGSLKAAIVHMAAYSDQGPINEGGTWIVTAEGAVLMSGTPNATVGNVPGKLCIAHGGQIRVINNLSVPVQYVLTVDWTA